MDVLYIQLFSFSLFVKPPLKAIDVSIPHYVGFAMDKY